MSLTFDRKGDIQPYGGSADLLAMIDLLMRARPPSRIDNYPSPTDLHELLSLESVQSRTQLWVDPVGGLVAFAFVDDFNNLRFEVDPLHASSNLEAEIVAWGIESLKGDDLTNPQTSEQPTLDASCREDDSQQIAFLKRHGFIQSADRTLHMARSLLPPIPGPMLPNGFIIRPVAELGEAEALVELHQAAFGTAHMNLELRLAMMSVPDYDPDLDLVAVAPDGRLAGYCFCFISQVEIGNAGTLDGYTDPVAVHPEFRRRGLARAMLLTGLRLLRARGVQTAHISTSASNLAMQRAAESVGYTIEATTIWFSKEIGR